MKRVMKCAIMAALLATGFVSAQDVSGEPSADSVLQAARDKYNANNGTQTDVPQTEAPAPAAETPEEIPGYPEPNFPDSPMVLGFVPWLSFPMGIYDSTVAASAIGALNGKITGLQVSGVFSTALDDVNGMQASGVFNIAAAKLTGAQLGGVFNLVGEDFNGIQSAGVFNIVGGSASWIQAAGVFNIVGGTMNGLQAAGVMNVSNGFSGTMASGVLNLTGRGKGLMIGLVNVADSLDGVAIGLVNIIKDGIWDINTDYQFDSKTAYLTYRSGTPELYAVAYVGQPTGEIFLSANDITTGAGFGHRFKVLFLTVDAELCYESSPADAYSALQSIEDCTDLDPALLNQVAGFGSLRVSFGFGRRKGFGVYSGIKADFGDWGGFTVPDRFRYSFGAKQSEGTMLFDKVRPFWPKWFIGIRY